MRTTLTESRTDTPPLRSTHRALGIAAAWAVVAAFFILQNVARSLTRGRPIDWQWDVIHEIIYWSLWALFTPLIVWLAQQNWLEAGVRSRVWLSHVFGGAVVGFAQVIATYTVHATGLRILGMLPPGGIRRFYEQVRGSVVVLALTGFLYYWVVLAVFYALAYRKLYLTKRAEAARAQLDALRAQLHPHFLFNALNSISVLIQENPAKANAVLVRLSDLLRVVLRQDERHEIPLAEELETLDRYLDIQRIRFDERLRIRVDVGDDVRHALVPTMILQPLVENAIRHAIEPRATGGEIVVTAARRGARLELTVRDDGPGIDPRSPEGNGIGLRNTRSRLEQLYGSQCEIVVTRAAGTGAELVLRIPWREAR